MSGDGATFEGLSDFNRLIGDLVKIGEPGTQMGAVVKDEVGHFLEACIRGTPGARSEVIQQRVTYRERLQYSAYSGGETGKNARHESTFISVGQRDPSKAWYVTPNTTGLSGETYRETTTTEDGKSVKIGKRHSRMRNKAGGHRPSLARHGAHGPPLAGRDVGGLPARRG